jgi:septal ring factor EnvC (AmiA/AmiB activator)
MRFRTLLMTAMALATTAAAAPHPPPKPSPKAQALARAVRDDRAQASGVEAQIAHLRSRLVALAAVEAVGERGTGDKKSRLDALDRQEQALTARLGRSQNATARLLGVLALFRRDPPPALLVHPDSARDAVRAQILARALAPELERRSRELSAQLTELHRLRRQVEVASEDLFTSESALAGQRGQLEQMLADKAALERSLAADADRDAAALRALARASGAPAELIGKLPPGDEGLGPAPERLVEPVQGRLVARFGQAAHKSGPKEGFTWQAAPGAPVLAPAAGVVEYAGPLKDYGVILIFKTGGAYHLVLAGLGATQAVAGRAVAAGEPVGRMAEDGSAAPDLYLELRRGGGTVDPARWFKARSAETPAGPAG